MRCRPAASRDVLRSAERFARCIPAPRLDPNCWKPYMERWQSAILNRLAGLPLSGSIAHSRCIGPASDCLLRVGEVAAVRVGDLADETVGFAHLSVLRSKTDPESHGATLYVDPSAMRRITAWRDDDDVQEQNPSPFPTSGIIHGQQAVPGVAGRVSGHSRRVGAAQSNSWTPPRAVPSPATRPSRSPCPTPAPVSPRSSRPTALTWISTPAPSGSAPSSDAPSTGARSRSRPSSRFVRLPAQVPHQNLLRPAERTTSAKATRLLSRPAPCAIAREPTTSCRKRSVRDQGPHGAGALLQRPEGSDTGRSAAGSRHQAATQSSAEIAREILPGGSRPLDPHKGQRDEDPGLNPTSWRRGNRSR